MSEENLLTSNRADSEIFVYGAKHLEKGRLKDSSGNHIVDESGNKLKFFTIVEEH